MRYFWIIDGRRPKTAKPCGLLTFDEESREWRIQIAPGVGVEDVPMLFIPFIERGELTIPPVWALAWVQERIPPINRQNIGEILEAHGIGEYDELTLLLSGEGRCSQDEFCIKEVEPIDEENCADGAGQGPRAESFYEYALVELPSQAETMLKGMVGDSIKEARKNQGLSQDDLARLSGVPHATICRIERGEANPTLETIADILDGLKVQPIFKVV